MCLNSVCVCRYWCWCCDCYWYVKNVDLARITLLFVYISVNYQSVKLIWRREERSATMNRLYGLVTSLILKIQMHSLKFVVYERTSKRVCANARACAHTHTFTHLFIQCNQKNRSDTVCQWHIHTLMSFGVFFFWNSFGKNHYSFAIIREQKKRV